jgi:hypothetical protein
VKVVADSIDPTFGRPRAAALVDHRCVFLIDPYPKPSDFERISGPISSDRSHHTGVLIGRDEAVTDPTDLCFWKADRAGCVGRWCIFAITPNGSMGRPSSGRRGGVGRAVLGGLDSLVRFALMDGRCGSQPTGDCGCALADPVRACADSRSQRLVRGKVTVVLYALGWPRVPRLGPRLRRAGTWVRTSWQMISACAKVCWLACAHQMFDHH